MKFSLIMSTLNRNDEIIILLDSLLSQSYKNFELIMVDQNNDDHVEKIYNQYKHKIDLQYFRCEKTGLSFGRNIGLENYTGNVIAFPDDDCEYETDTLAKVADFFEKYPGYSFCTCNTKDKNSEFSILPNTLSDSIISINNVMRIGISFTIFVRSPSLRLFKFDEQMGVGAPFGSGEESDLLFFLLKHKNKGIYHSKNYIYHPVKTETPEKAFLYGMGCGAVYKKAITHYGFFILFPIFFLRILKGIINVIIKKDKKNRTASLCGRISGFIKY